MTGHDPHPAVLRMRGDIDFFTEDDFRAEAERLLEGEAITGLVVDLGEVATMDSSGLGLLVDLLRLCQEIGLSMTLREVPDQLRQLLDLTELGQLIRVE